MIDSNENFTLTSIFLENLIWLQIRVALILNCTGIFTLNWR